MEGLIPIAVWITLILIAGGLLIIAVFGIRNLVSGKFRPWSIGAMLLPVVVFGIGYLLASGGPDPAVTAGVWTVLVLMAIGAIAIVVTGLKGLTGF